MSGKENMELLWNINKNVEEISAKIDRLISLYEFAQKHDLEKFKEEVLGRSKIRGAIYGLCDGTKTVNEISRSIGKSLPHTSKELTVLEDAGLIRSRDIGRKKYYVRVV